MKILNQGVSLEEALIYGPSRLDYGSRPCHRTRDAVQQRVRAGGEVGPGGAWLGVHRPRQASGPDVCALEGRRRQEGRGDSAGLSAAVTERPEGRDRSSEARAGSAAAEWLAGAARRQGFGILCRRPRALRWLRQAGRQPPDDGPAWAGLLALRLQELSIRVGRS